MNWHYLKLTSLWALIFFMGVVASYFYFKPAKFDLDSINKQILGPVDPGIANPNIEAYRHARAYASLSLYPNSKVSGILHDTAEFKKYIDTTFKYFVATHKPKPGYTWQFGLYPMVCKLMFEGKMRPRIGVYLIPTMAVENVSSPLPSQIIDYFTAKDGPDSIYYIKTSERSNPKKMVSDQFIFDEGHLWP